MYRIIIFSLFLINCSIKQNNSYKDPLDIYYSAIKDIQQHKYEYAIRKLENLKSLYLNNNYSKLIQINLIYSYYKTSNLLIAKDIIEDFLKLNKINEYNDYLLYMHGLINMLIDKNKSLRILCVNYPDYNIENAYIAFCDFNKLIKEYPYSLYSVDAYNKQEYLRNRLIKYDLSIIKYYFKRKLFIPVINRSKKILKDFPDSIDAKEAIIYMKKSYLKLIKYNKTK